MQARRRTLAAVTVVLAGALCVPASAVSPAGVGSAGAGSGAGAVVPAGAGRVIAGPKAFLRPFRPGDADAARRDPQASAGAQQLAYGGGSAAYGHGVQTRPAVYLVFWGSQWSRSDPYADYEQRFFRGLYGKGDDWTRIQREFCEGAAVGAVTCPRNKPRIGAPIGGGVLKGVWWDDSSLAVPDDTIVAKTGLDSVTAEAVRAAAHFHRTTPASNINVQYVISEPSHFDSPGYGVFCAYHSFADSSSYGGIVFTDLPYVTDIETNGSVPAGISCGRGMVNPGAAGAYDGLSMVVGHEFIEVLTDPYVGTGWVDGSGQETGDKCAYKKSGPGAMSNLRLTTGTFAVQGMWSNLANNGRGQCVTHQR
jgi:hypothetical protein